MAYDVNDYDALIEPLKRSERAFVLGSRNVGNWKIRKFTDQLAVGTLFNLGHLVFAGLLNMLYRQRLRPVLERLTVPQARNSRCICLSPDGRWLVWNENQRTRVWNIVEQRELEPSLPSDRHPDAADGE